MPQQKPDAPAPPPNTQEPVEDALRVLVGRKKQPEQTPAEPTK